MMRSAIGLAVALVALGAAVSAQKTTNLKVGGGGSPHVRTEWTIDGGNLSIEYGRPSLKGRTPGKDLDPYAGKEWRTGADEATTLKTDKMLMFGALHVPAGTYTLYTMPSGSGWQLIVSKKTGQWGIPYPQGEDLGRAPMSVSNNAKPVEQLTISIEDTKAGATLHIDWGSARASIPFTIG
jgi:Protein of unknown function (DUF2911)